LISSNPNTRNRADKNKSCKKDDLGETIHAHDVQLVVAEVDDTIGSGRRIPAKLKCRPLCMTVIPTTRRIIGPLAITGK
jgi:hypothetical protein